MKEGSSIKALSLSPAPEYVMTEIHGIATVGTLVEVIAECGRRIARGPKKGGWARFGPASLANVVARLQANGFTIEFIRGGAIVTAPPGFWHLKVLVVGRGALVFLLQAGLTAKGWQVTAACQARAALEAADKGGFDVALLESDCPYSSMLGEALARQLPSDLPKVALLVHNLEATPTWPGWAGCVSIEMAVEKFLEVIERAAESG